MIRAVKDLKSKSSYVEMVCDICNQPCEASRTPGRFGGRNGLHHEPIAALAKQHGWVERMVDDPPSPRRRKWSATIQSICPACQEKTPCP